MMFNAVSEIFHNLSPEFLYKIHELPFRTPILLA